MDAKVTEDVKKVKIDENAAPQPEIGGHEVCTLKSRDSMLDI